MTALSITARSLLMGTVPNSVRSLDVATLMLVAVDVHDPLGPGPLLERPVLSESFELPLPRFVTAAKGFQSRAVLFRVAVHIDTSSSEKRSG